MNQSHHALLYYADELSQLPSEYIEVASDPDVRTVEYGTVSIGDVRAIQDVARQRPVCRAQFTIVLIADAIAHEAQHALLKTLEEPAGTTCIVLVLRKRTPLLPTIWSRVAYMGDMRAQSEEHSPQFRSFLQSGVAVRLQAIADNAKAKRVDWMRSTLSEVARYVSTQLAIGTLSHGHAARLTDCGLYAERSGASLKMILEEVALTLPVVKG